MEKVLLIIPENNKGKYILKGFGNSFKELSYFVIEKKIPDLNTEETIQINPEIIVFLWSNVREYEKLSDYYVSLKDSGIKFIHLAESIKNVPPEIKRNTDNYIFSIDSEIKKYKIKQSINASEYKTNFDGYKYKITFAGNPAYKEREKLLSELIKNFGPINIFCRSFDFYKSADEILKEGILDEHYLELYRASYKGYVESKKELADIYVSSGVNLDMRNPDKENINYRCLEITSSGGFLIAAESEDYNKYFESGKETEVYNTAEELTDKINFYLKNLNLAQLIAAKGKKRTITNYGSKDVLKTILKVVYGKDISSR